MRRLAMLSALAVACVVSWAGCPKDSPTPASGGSKAPKAKITQKNKISPKKETAKTPGTITGAGFKVVVTPPKGAKVGAEILASVSLEPRGEYKVNLEYPLRLTVEGPTAATPVKAILTKKDAKMMTAKHVLLLHKCKLGKVGAHQFSAEFRFSVCTKRHCELKRETLTWVVKVE